MTTTAEDGNGVGPNGEDDLPEGTGGGFAPLGLFEGHFGPPVSSDAERTEGDVTSVSEAIDRMDAITAAQPEEDGLRQFNVLYTTITMAVEERLAKSMFVDADFLTRLDIAFANRYFAALRAWGEGQPQAVPRVWRVLLERRRVDKIAPFQFAVAGVNAHINFDLAPALIRTPCRELEDIDPQPPGDQRNDYEQINTIFLEKYAGLRDRFTSGEIDRLDEGMVARAIDYISNFIVDKARDEAWEKAQRIYAYNCDNDAHGAARVQENLDRRWGHFGKALLARGLF